MFSLSIIKTKNNYINPLWRIGAIFAAIILNSFSLSLAYTPITITAEVNKHSVAIGDKIKYALTVSCSKDIEVEFPDFAKNLENFAVKDFGESRKTFFGKQTINIWYLLDTYVTGESTIPKATIKYRQKGQTAWNEAEIKEQKITVKSMLENAGPNPGLRDIKKPVNLPQKINLYLIIIILFLGAAIIILTVFLLKTKARLGLSSLKAAHELAYEQLNALKKKDLIAQGKIMEFYIEISDITRHYIENRFNIKAPEMTTEEFFAKAKEHAQLKTEHKTLLKEFLVCCDLVKFAKYFPPSEEINSAFETAEKFIEQTKEEQKEPVKLKK